MLGAEGKKPAASFPGCGVLRWQLRERCFPPQTSPQENAWLALHKLRASMELHAGFRVARLSAVGFGAVGSLLCTFLVIFASAGCVRVRRQPLFVLFVSDYGGH